MPASYLSKALFAPAGKNFVRDDGESPEATAAGNIAKAQQSSGNAIDSIKCGVFVQRQCDRACCTFSMSTLCASFTNFCADFAGRAWGCD